MIRGSIGSHTCSIEFKENLKDDDGNDLVGQCQHDSLRGHIRIYLDPNLAGVGLFDTLVHEGPGHGTEYVFGLDISHQTVYTIASAMTQFYISTGLIDPQEFEARLRALMTK